MDFIDIFGVLVFFCFVGVWYKYCKASAGSQENIRYEDIECDDDSDLDIIDTPIKDNIEDDVFFGFDILGDQIKASADMLFSTTDIKEFEQAYLKLSESLKSLCAFAQSKKIDIAFSLLEGHPPLPIDIAYTHLTEEMEGAIGTFIYRVERKLHGILDFDQRMIQLDEFVLAMEDQNSIINKMMTERNKNQLSTVATRNLHRRGIAAETRKNNILSKLGYEPHLDITNIEATEIMEYLQENIDSLHYDVTTSYTTASERGNAFQNFKYCCSTYNLPSVVKSQLNELLDEWEDSFKRSSTMDIVDSMDGFRFERWCASILSANGFDQVSTTPGSNDQGVDIIAVKDEIRYAIQCKCYAHDLGNTPIQEVNTGKSIYKCQVGVVMTNRYFTEGAKVAAQATGTLLWDRDKIISMAKIQNVEV